MPSGNCTQSFFFLLLFYTYNGGKRGVVAHGPAQVMLAGQVFFFPSSFFFLFELQEAKENERRVSSNWTSFVSLSFLFHFVALLFSLVERIPPFHSVWTNASI